MRIYGKSFGEIFRLLPWQFKTVVVVGIAFLLFIVFHFARLAVAPSDSSIRPVVIDSLSPYISMFDPALAGDGDRRVWMAFTNIRPLQGGGGAAPGLRFAHSVPPCDRWMLARAADIPARAAVIYAPDGTSVIAEGVWRYETPALIHDPQDRARPWKLYAYKYLWTPDANMGATRRYGVIAHWHTDDPDKGWSTEEWALSAAPGYPPPPYQDMVHTHISALDPSLEDIHLYARPSVVSVRGTLLMSLSAFRGTETQPDRIILLSSPDHGRSWRYLGSPLARADAARVGDYTYLGGGTLLVQDGHVLLAAVLGDGETAGLGTFVFAFEDISKGLLRRDPRTGAPVLLNHIPRSSHKPAPPGGGYAAYHPACKQGVYTGEYSSIKNAFQVFKTLRKPIDLD